MATTLKDRSYRLGQPSLAKPLAVSAAAIVVGLAAFVLTPDIGGNSGDYDATTEPAPGAAADTNVVEGQGAEPYGAGGVLEPGLLPDVENPVAVAE